MAKVAKQDKRGTAGSKKKAVAKLADTKKPAVATERWTEQPEEHDYPAAAAFLSLVCEPTEVRKLVTALKAAPIVRHQAKDLLRASALALLPVDNAHVASDLAKVGRGDRLSPVLLVRGDFRRGMALTIADGYHRVCASYHLDENADIPCHLVDYKGPTAAPAFRQRSTANAGTAARPPAPTLPSGPASPLGPTPMRGATPTPPSDTSTAGEPPGGLAPGALPGVAPGMGTGSDAGTPAAEGDGPASRGDR